jgi:hypothetical protein
MPSRRVELSAEPFLWQKSCLQSDSSRPASLRWHGAQNSAAEIHNPSTCTSQQSVLSTINNNNNTILKSMEKLFLFYNYLFITRAKFLFVLLKIRQYFSPHESFEREDFNNMSL